MERRLEVDGGLVGDVSSRLIAAGDKVVNARAALLAGLDELGKPWGKGDEFADTFSASYLPARDEATDAADDLGTFLLDLGYHVRSTGDSYSSVDNS